MCTYPSLNPSKLGTFWPRLAGEDAERGRPFIAVWPETLGRPHPIPPQPRMISKRPVGHTASLEHWTQARYTAGAKYTLVLFSKPLANYKVLWKHTGLLPLTFTPPHSKYLRNMWFLPHIQRALNIWVAFSLVHSRCSINAGESAWKII